MSTQAFYIVYDGPALVDSQVPVEELVPPLVSLSRLFEEANTILNGEQATAQLNVKGSFKTGCFGVDLVVIQKISATLLAWMQTDHPTLCNASMLCGVLGFLSSGKQGLLWLIRKVAGRKIHKVEYLGDDKVRIHVDNEMYETEKQVLELFRNMAIRQAIESIIAKPLKKEGVEYFGVATSAKDPLYKITAAEASIYQAPMLEDEDLETREYETNWQIESLSFQDGNKWRFSDGGTPFYAKITDPDFLQQINEHKASFAKNDILRVKVNESQYLTAAGIKAERTITKVLSHRSATLQIPLPVDKQE